MGRTGKRSSKKTLLWLSVYVLLGLSEDSATILNSQYVVLETASSQHRVSSKVTTDYHVKFICDKKFGFLFSTKWKQK